MDRTKVDATLDGLARDMVSAIERILTRLISVSPTEEIGADIPLTFHEVRAVKALPPAGSVSMSALANSIGISLPAATRLVDHLVAKGVAARFRPDDDRRRVLVALTEQAKVRRQALFEHHVRLLQDILCPLGAAERERMVQAFREIARLMQPTAPHSGGELPPTYQHEQGVNANHVVS